MRKSFWERVPMDEMTIDEWEAICDGCGNCCLIKLEDEDSGNFLFTNVSCRLLDTKTCRCGNYALRKQIVKDCVILTPDNIEDIAEWMPATCAYRLLHEGAPLPDWHPLLSGDNESVVKSGASVKNWAIPEYEIDMDDIEDYIVGE
ncbi:MAG: YcgN family cysteine cluster protein [Rhodobacteraceae bacterium]|nr:YcgN family cysteine cluster protein [Paracoccaceae bacterium]